MRSYRKGIRVTAARAGGFTLLEVLAALMIAAVCLTWLLQSQSASIEGAGRTRDLRQATLLAGAKLRELAAGIEPGQAGEFEERPGWRWEAVREPVEGVAGVERLLLTLSYTSLGRARSLRLERLVR